MSVGEVVARLEQVKLNLTEAPYGAVANGLGKLTITGLDEVRGVVERIVADLPEHKQNAHVVETTAQDGVKEVTATAAGADTSPHSAIDAALGDMHRMGERAEQVGIGIGEMGENLKTALGHLAAFEACVDRHTEMVETARDHNQQSGAAAVAAVEHITDYQQDIAG